MKTQGLMALPSSRALLANELARIEREQPRTAAPRARRLLAIERRRVLIALDQAGA